MWNNNNTKVKGQREQFSFSSWLTFPLIILSIVISSYSSLHSSNSGFWALPLAAVGPWKRERKVITQVLNYQRPFFTQDLECFCLSWWTYRSPLTISENSLYFDKVPWRIIFPNLLTSVLRSLLRLQGLQRSWRYAYCHQAKERIMQTVEGGEDTKHATKDRLAWLLELIQVSKV